MTHALDGVGIWSAALRYGDRGEAAAAAAELEALGYRALWLPDVGGDVFGALEHVLRATRDVTVATGILNLWMHEPSETAREYARLVAAHGRRLLVGIGVSHAPLIDATEPGRYAHPLARTEAYLDALDAISPTLPSTDRLLAALGPQMLSLAGAKAAGTHPYNVTPEHTARARAALGPHRLVAPEQGVVLETDRDRAREIARAFLATYLMLPNYVNNWYRLGFTEADTADGGSDALVDALVAWGDVDAITARVQAHFDAGADHVCIQVLTAETLGVPMTEWRELAPALRDLSA
ncbi:MAG: LLM class F420-dependent oxidoreductase [Actinobacteria bacterium]|nr:LLM class F420-dependent oxidoreductase [Actinomycetota bacterium]